MPLFFSFAQVREDLARFTSGLSEELVWKDVEGASLGFHLKHLSGSIERLTTYLFEGQLSPEQLQALAKEHVPDLKLPELLANVDNSTKNCEQRLLTLKQDSLFEPRYVGRRRLPTTVIGLLVHIAEHTQRHLGQAITIAKVVRQPG
jgi:uncharacterized damage-inducible protein DinB